MVDEVVEITRSRYAPTHVSSRLAPASSYGPFHDICNPANTIYSTSPEPEPCSGAKLSAMLPHLELVTTQLDRQF